MTAPVVTALGATPACTVEYCDFNTCANESCWNSTPSLISHYDGTPTSYGTGLRDHLRVLNGQLS